MSVTAPSPTATPPAARDPQRPLLLGIGGVLLGLGALVALAGVVVLALFGSDGRLATGRQQLDTPTAALVTGAARITDAAQVADVLGTTSIQVSANAAGDRGVFVGIGRTADVDRYLSGAAVDEVTDFDVDPFRITRRTQPGTATPAPPADQSFWVTQSNGDDSAGIDWKVRDGSYRLVVMNADGSNQVATQTTVGVTIENLPAIAWGILILGLVITSGGALLLVTILRRRRD